MIAPDLSGLNEYPLLCALLKNGTLMRVENKIFYSKQREAGPLLQVDAEGVCFTLHGERMRYLPPAAQQRGDLLKQPVKESNFALLAQSHRYDQPILGHSWLNIYIPEVMNKELHHTKKQPSRFSGTRFNMADTLFAPSEGAIVENTIQGHDRGDVTGLDIALLLPVTRQCAAHVAMNGFLKAIAQGDAKLHRSYQALPIFGRNCTRGSKDALAEVGIDLDAMIGTNALSFSPADYGRRIRALVTESVPPLVSVSVKGKEGCANIIRASARNALPVLILEDNGMCDGSYLPIDEKQKVELSTDLILQHAGEAMKRQWFAPSASPTETVSIEQEHLKDLAVDRVESTKKTAFKLPLGPNNVFDSYLTQRANGASLVCH